MAQSALTLPEQILLLVLKDREGSLLGATHFRYAVAGAALAELLLQGRIELEQGASDPLVTVTRREPSGDPVLDDTLGQFLTATRRTDPERWIGRLAEREELRMEVAKQLCRKGVLDEHEGRVRLVFRRTVYVDLDPDAEREVTDRVRDAVFGTGEVDGRIALLTALAAAGDILTAIFEADEVEAHRERVQAILDHGALDDSIREAVSVLVSATEAAVLEGGASTA